MHTRRLVAVVVATLALSAGLIAGCSKSNAGGPLPDAAALLKESTQATKELKSAHLHLAVTGDIEGVSIKTLDGDLTNVPKVAAKGTAQVDFGHLIDAPFVVLDGHLWTKIFGAWDYEEKASDVYDVSVILNPDIGLANLLAKITDPKAEGRETVDGQHTVRISGKVPADAVNNLQLKATEAMAVTVWIQEQGDHQLVRAQLHKTSDSAIQMTLSKWNEPVTVEKPAGAPGP